MLDIKFMFGNDVQGKDDNIMSCKQLKYMLLEFNYFPKLMMDPINFVSRNQLHCAANLNFGLICRKAKQCWALSTKFSFLCS